MKPILGIRNNDGNREPQMYKLHDFTEGGTNIINQKMGTYTTKSKRRKWTRVVLAYILDTIRVNPSTIVTLNSNNNPKSTDSFKFRYEFATQLVMPHIQRRS